MEGEAMATLWHEVTHNRHKGLDGVYSHFSERSKECANEWVSRHTLNEFYDRLGVKHKTRSMLKYMGHNEVLDYDTMVTNYDHIIQVCGLNRKKVLESVRNGLFFDDYDNQLEVLVKGLLDGGLKHIDGTFANYNVASELVRSALCNVTKDDITILAKTKMIKLI